MKRKEKLAFRQHQSTRQLMGIQRITAHGVTTERGEMVFFLVRPDNLTVLSAEGVRARITALTKSAPCGAGGGTDGLGLPRIFPAQ